MREAGTAPLHFALGLRIESTLAVILPFPWNGQMVPVIVSIVYRDLPRLIAKRVLQFLEAAVDPGAGRITWCGQGR